jgi:DNA excision repair protein ERCC-6
MVSVVRTRDFAFLLDLIFYPFVRLEMGLGKTVQVAAYLGAMAASRKLDSVLVIGPATILQHWLTELSTWAPGLRRILIHQSGETDGLPRTVTTKLLKSLDNWLRSVRADRLNEAIDEEDFETFDEASFCGTGYVVVTTYENIRRTPDTWTAHNWSYVVMDEGQKIRNPDADVTIACKVSCGVQLLYFVIVARYSSNHERSACEHHIVFY